MTGNPSRVIIWAAVSSQEQAADKKMSIPDQLARQRERAARNGWIVIDEIIIDGFSRDYWTFYEFAHAAAAEGFVDPLRMFQHWEQRDFDILSCRDLSRLGREQSILNEVIGRTIAMNAVIMPLDESPVDAVNYRMIGAIGGVGAAEHLDKLKRGREMGMKARVSRGQTVTSQAPKFYITGADGKLKPNREEYQRFFDDLAELFLAGVAYNRIPGELERRGHINKSLGKPYDRSEIKRLFIKSRTWGHAEFNRTGTRRGFSNPRTELFCTGRGEPPDDVYFQRDVFEPIWSGQTKEALIDELERRFYAIRGTSRPDNTYPFSYLCVCDYCGHNMIVQVKHARGHTYSYVVCHHGKLRDKGCINNKLVRFDKVQDFLTDIINALLQRPANDLTLPEVRQSSRVPQLEREIAKTTTRLSNLIDLISTAPVSSRADYQAKIDALSQQRDRLQAERSRYELDERQSIRRQKSLMVTLDSIRAGGAAHLWTLPITQQNQILRKLLGRQRIACNDGEVIGLRDTGGGS